MADEFQVKINVKINSIFRAIHYFLSTSFEQIAKKHSSRAKFDIFV